MWRTALISCAALTLMPAAASPPAAQPVFDVRVSADEAEAALAILAKRRRGRPVANSDWARLFESEGYRRLRDREASMGRAFDEADFRAFLLADSTLARAAALDSTLRDWKRLSLVTVARRAQAYLPAGTPLRATVHLMIKPRSNSFVFDLSGDPAIFLFVDPGIPRPRLLNTIAHELHHVGYARACATFNDSADAPERRAVRRWLGAFGEGVAVLAAAGGSLIQPDQTWSEPDRREWRDDMLDTYRDLARLERFFLALADGSLADPDSVRARALPFYGNRGAWYTIGYTMAAAVERAFGRERLIDTLCDPIRLPLAYQAAVPVLAAKHGAELPRWSEAMIAMLREDTAARDD
jgi:hypothetical protein